MTTSKAELEAFRARQYAAPHPALAPQPQSGGGAPAGAPTAARGAAAAPAAAPSPAAAAELIVPDSGRVVIHFDLDCFYAQVEENRDPSLRGRPLGVTQKYLVVTCNYPAREQGVTKLVNVAEARRRCPSIVLVNGEDLTPYRAASKRILAALQRFGRVERLGLDEFFLDATPLAKQRLAALGGGVGGAGAVAGTVQLPPWHGHVHSGSSQLQQDSRHRPMDLRAVASEPAAPAGAAQGMQPPPGAAAAATAAGAASGRGSWEALLRLGSAIAAEARAAVAQDAGYRASAGIAANKLLAKLCSGLHKPNDQTALPPPEAAAFVAPLPVRALPGVGHKLEQELQAMGVATAADLRALPRPRLVQRFGERTGAFLFDACRGKDASAVQEQGPPKSVTVEDSFKSCASFAAAEKVVRVLAPDLLARLQEELQEGGRRPATLCVKWRLSGSGWQRASASCAMPQGVPSSSAAAKAQVEALAAAAMKLLRDHLREPFDLSLINLGAVAFCDGPAAAGGTRSITDMLAGAAARAAGAPEAGPEGSHREPAAGATAAAPVAQAQGQHQGAAVGRSAAAASAEQRRTYSAAPAQAPLLSKRHERQLREHGNGYQQQQQQQQQHEEHPWHKQAGGSVADGAERQQSLGLQPPGPGMQQPGHAAHAGAGFGFDEWEAEEDDSSVWQDLQGLADWRSSSRSGTRGAGRAPAPAAVAAAAAAPSGGGLPAAAAQGPRAGSVPAQAAVAPGAGAAHAGAAAAPAGAVSSEGRVVLHADADAFYCQVECLDDPSLRGRPLAVQQFNAGGFVAVSYEARAAGIRCGDGAGAAGRAAVPHLMRMQAASLEECRRRCPGLQVAQQVHALLRTFAPDGQVEKTSYDDFYLEASVACGSASSAAAGAALAGGGSPGEQQPWRQHAQLHQQPPDRLLFLSGASKQEAQQQQQQQWEALPADLRRGVALAAALRAAAKQQLGITLSVGIARNKLLARLASPCGKPDGLAVVPDAAAVAFICHFPLQKVPLLRGKFGEAVSAELGAATVGQLAAFPRADLARRFGDQRGAFLAALPLAQDDAPVRERGPQKSIAAERSFPPLASEAAASAELEPLARTLLARAAEDAQQHCRLPSKLLVSYRQGYGGNPRSKSGAVPAEVLRWLRHALQAPQQPVQQRQHAAAAPDAAVAAVVAAAVALLRPAVAVDGWQLTRLAVSLAYEESGKQAGPAAGQLSLAAFEQWRGKGGAAAGGAAGEGVLQQPQPQQQPQHQQPSAWKQQQQQHQQPSAGQHEQHEQQQQQRHPPPKPAVPASYRNAEALTVQQMFGGSGSGGRAAQLALSGDLAAEERASLELALRLQEEEAQAAAAEAAARKRPAAGPAGGGGRQAKGPKQQRRGSGPLDAFVRRGS